MVFKHLNFISPYVSFLTKVRQQALNNHFKISFFEVWIMVFKHLNFISPCVSFLTKVRQQALNNHFQRNSDFQSSEP